MSDKFANRKKLKKNLRIKNLTYPVLAFLDKTNALPYFQSVINKSLKVLKIKKQFNSELNYRTYSKIFKNAFSNNQEFDKATILIPCFHPVNSTIFLRQMMLAKYLMQQGHKVLFVVCDGYFNICQIERFGKTRNDFKHLCHECSHHYKFVQKETNLPLNYLSEFGSLVDSSAYQKICREVENLKTVKACENFSSFDGIPLGEINKVGVLRFFQKGQLEETTEILNVYKKYLKDTYRSNQIFSQIIRVNQVHKTILWSGSTGHEKMIAYVSQQIGIDYITQEMYIGNNSWIYKKNAVAIHLDYYENWLNKKDSLNFTSEQRTKVLNLFSGMKSGTTFNVSYNDSTKKLDLDPSKKYAVLFTNMNFDMYVLGRNPVFESMKAWVRETISFWREHVQDVTLIIRAHPGELKLVTASVDFVSEAVQLKASDNILFYDSDSDINSYDLLNIAQYVLTYSSTIGAEALLSNIPCISAGETMYQNFCSAPRTKEAYFDAVIEHNASKFPKIDKESLLNYLHYLMFIQNVEVQGFKINRKVGKVEFDSKLQTAEELQDINNDALKQFYIDVILSEI